MTMTLDISEETVRDRFALRRELRAVLLAGDVAGYSALAAEAAVLAVQVALRRVRSAEADHLAKRKTVEEMSTTPSEEAVAELEAATLALAKTLAAPSDYRGLVDGRRERLEERVERAREAMDEPAVRRGLAAKGVARARDRIEQARHDLETTIEWVIDATMAIAEEES